MENIIWKAVPEFEGLYEANQLGQIKSLPKRGFNVEKILKPQKNLTTGYLYFFFKKNNKVKSINIHRIIAKLFISNPENKPCVNHRNGNKTDNHYSNLEWCTYSENTLHSYENQLQVKLFGDDCYNVKIADKDINEIFNFIKNGKSIKEIAKQYNVHPSTISKIKHGKARKNHNIPLGIDLTDEEKYKDVIELAKKMIILGKSDLSIENKTGIGRKSKFLKKLKDDIC